MVIAPCQSIYSTVGIINKWHCSECDRRWHTYADPRPTELTYLGEIIDFPDASTRTLDLGRKTGPAPLPGLCSSHSFIPVETPGPTSQQELAEKYNWKWTRTVRRTFHRGRSPQPRTCWTEREPWPCPSASNNIGMSGDIRQHVSGGADRTTFRKSRHLRTLPHQEQSGERAAAAISGGSVLTVVVQRNARRRPFLGGMAVLLCETNHSSDKWPTLRVGTQETKITADLLQFQSMPCACVSSIGGAVLTGIRAAAPMNVRSETEIHGGVIAISCFRRSGGLLPNNISDDDYCTSSPAGETASSSSTIVSLSFGEETFRC